jgi:hypothetical protein
VSVKNRMKKLVQRLEAIDAKPVRWPNLIVSLLQSGERLTSDGQPLGEAAFQQLARRHFVIEAVEPEPEGPDETEC